MNKTELIAQVAQKTGLTKKDATAAVCAVFDTIVEQMKAEEKVQIVGFGTFEVRTRSSRMGRDPRTNENIMIAESKLPVFKAGKTLKLTVNPEKE